MGKHSARGADVVSRTGAAPGNESQARRRSHRPLPGRAAIRALTVENGQGNVACMLPGLLHFDANPTYICDSVTPSVKRGTRQKSETEGYLAQIQDAVLTVDASAVTWREPPGHTKLHNRMPHDRQPMRARLPLQSARLQHPRSTAHASSCPSPCRRSFAFAAVCGSAAFPLRRRREPQTNRPELLEARWTCLRTRRPSQALRQQRWTTARHCQNRRDADCTRAVRPPIRTARSTARSLLSSILTRSMVENLMRVARPRQPTGIFTRGEQAFLVARDQSPTVHREGDNRRVSGRGRYKGRVAGEAGRGAGRGSDEETRMRMSASAHRREPTQTRLRLLHLHDGGLVLGSSAHRHARGVVGTQDQRVSVFGSELLHASGRTRSCWARLRPKSELEHVQLRVGAASTPS